MTPPSGGRGGSEATLETTDEAGAVRTSTLEIEMEKDGAVKGTGRTTNPEDGSELEYQVTGRVRGKTLFLEAELTLAGAEVELESELEIDGDELRGRTKVRVPGQAETEVHESTGKRRPKGARGSR